MKKGMMKLFNQAIVVGRLGSDPELKYLQNGTAVVTGSVACPRPTAKGKEKITDWIRFTAWGKTAEAVANFAKKGNRILVVGRIQIDKWQDANGDTKSAVNLNAQSVQFVDYSEPANTNDSIREQVSDDDLPF